MLSRTLLILLPLSTPGLRYHQIISAFFLILCLYLAQLRSPPPLFRTTKKPSLVVISEGKRSVAASGLNLWNR
ncbi:hypothetical protein BDV30DRAFT_55627 [Aspergillus minisclerotigenes]|uniref:Uncharacterized protein n=1 Tax=Aspergillus minisclerotigenes TaxID=656917 RepID=A0A5N6IP94_9EURO|nr:hypothetical protein BDV30DRAFT_55627 [Aspergillus minisclerotigenes]